MRRSPLVLAALLAGGGLAALASASTPAGSTVTAPSHGSATASWTGSVGPGADSGGCSTSAVVTNDHHAVTFKVPSGLYQTVTTKTTIAVSAVGGNDIDLLVSDKSGSTVGESASGSGDEKVVLTDLAAGTYDVEVCAGTVLSDSYKATFTTVSTARPKGSTTGSGAVAARPALMTFTPATVVDPVLFGGEPGLTFDQTSAGGSARSFVDWPVTSRTMIGVLFRSEDGGLSYTKRYAANDDAQNLGTLCATRQVPYCPAGGGGDTDIDVNPTTGTVSMGEQESLANQAVGVSLDHGTSFPVNHVDPALDKTGGGVDRQWQASWAGTKTRFMAYHVPLLGEFVNRSDNDGATGSWTIPNQPQIIGVTQSGSMVADNSGGPLNHTLYIGYIGAGALVPGAQSGFAVGVSRDGAKTFTTHAIPGAASPRSFTVLNVDKAGNLYAVWVDSGTQHVYLATSLASDPVNQKAPATKWSKPVQIDKAPLNVTIFGNIVAGSKGRIAVGYYGTTAKAATPDAVTKGEGGWKPYIAYSADALCQWGAHPCESPTFSQDPIAHKINHDTNICTSGTTCAANPNSNRNLLDYFSIDVDKQGHLGFVWSDTDNATLEPFVKVARQASGPSLFAGQPAASIPMRQNGQGDALGDAKYPIAGTKILTAKNQPALDLQRTTVQRASNGDVVVTVKAPGLHTSQDGVLPAGQGGLDDSGTTLQQTRFVTRWDYRGQAYYAEMTLTGQEGSVAYGSGTVSSAEGQFNGGNVTATLGNTYQPLTGATGTFRSGTYVIRVPAAAAGSPKAGDTLYSVGSYSLIGPADTPAGSVQDLPITIDSTPTFDAQFGVATATVPATPAKTGLPPALPVKKPSTGGGLAATGLPGGIALVALVLLSAAALVKRRRTA